MSLAGACAFTTLWQRFLPKVVRRILLILRLLVLLLFPKLLLPRQVRLLLLLLLRHQLFFLRLPSVTSLLSTYTD